MAGILGMATQTDIGAFGRRRTLLDLFGARQKIGKSDPAPSVYQLGSTGARIAARQRLAQSEARVLKAADALRESTPAAMRDTKTSREKTGAERIASTRTISFETEVTTPATSAAQFSIAFQSADATIAIDRSRLEFGVSGGSNVRIDVGAAGASLQDIAGLINDNEDNLGRLEASVISTPEGFRLQVVTTEAGRGARLRIRSDDLEAPATGTPSTPPVFGNYELIDAALAVERGSDEVAETMTVEEDVTTYRNVSTYTDVEQSTFVEDEDFEAISREFVDALNALRSELGEQLEPSGPGHSPRLLADDPHVLALSKSLSALTEEFGERTTGKGSGFALLGIAVDAEGTLQIDHTVFQNALVDHRDEIGELLTTGEDALAQQAKDLLLRESQPRAFSGYAVFNDWFRDADSGNQGRLQLLSELFRIQSRTESNDV